ncbi:MAG: carbohydrate kinase [Chloroflexi bacterium AL-W]|nr:carbohydrate kinase [Chloroflexi bacterium AL-N1]NOK66524.1 carbohydrate kinase [Chloroflexi bacterium AL-N10]NOK71912.1 carbohydrate kinase [Chloroflexi bacterium AL-N5]NOK81169.1 carbohydrate kinase [Chloroflexi bacterium AL-W]NOK89442.1 carbohydrate kinase [Chloroflexi bacterium AL-N15]
MQQYVLGVDQGSSGSRAMILDSNSTIVGYGYQPVQRIYPQPGWVEQSPQDIAESVRQVIQRALAQARCPAHAIIACGITSQRDTVIAWDQQSGKPIGNAITWQDLRTVPLVAEIDTWEHAGERRERLGQFPGPYCSAMHMAWRMRHDSAFRSAALEGRLAVSLVPGWLIQALGKPTQHALDYSLMQGMTVLDFRRKQLWDAWIEHLQIPRAALPTPVSTLSHFGEIDIVDHHGDRAAVPVLAMISDQQAALFGYDCHKPGQASCTHGTASFVSVVAGATAPPQGIPKIYIGWELDGVTTYCVEADTTVTGAVVRWMQEQMGWLPDATQLGPLAQTVPDAAGVVFIPAFTGLGVPLEDRTARGTLLGMTLDTTPAHIARAFLDALGYQIYDILTTIQTETGLSINRLHVGGGVAASDLACQIQADILGVPIARASNTETSVRAAALLAGLGSSVWSSIDALPRLAATETIFEPQLSTATRDNRLVVWHRALERVREWS